MKSLILWHCMTLMCVTAYAQTASEEKNQAGASREAVASRIARVEQGLSSRIVVKGASNQKMSLLERMAFHQVPAVSIAVVNQGRIEWARAYGWADVASQRRATTATLFQAGSISKALTAMGALRLVEQGKLKLDADVNRYLVSWKIPVNDYNRDVAISLRMLLNHSAGMTVHGYSGYKQGQVLPALPALLDGVLPANSEALRVDQTPGQVWRYSGGGYSVVQLLISDVSGKTFDQFIRAEVLQRIGMKASTFATDLEPAWQRLAATAYEGSGKAVQGRWHRYPESAAAGLWSTPSDLARLLIEVQESVSGKSNKVLSADTSKLMLTRGLGEYGLGFFVEDLGKLTSFSHSGGSEGFRAQLYGYTRAGQGVVVMTNSQNGGTLIEEILCSIAAEYEWPEFKVEEKSAIPGDIGNYQKLAGDYQLLDLPARIIAEEDKLYLQSNLFGARRLEMFAQSDTAFFTVVQDMTIHFVKQADGTVNGFRLFRGTNNFPATKIR